MRFGRLLCLMAAVLCLCITAEAAASDSASKFAGRWDITVRDPRGAYPSWVEVRLEKASPVVDFVGKIGSVQQLRDASVRDGVLQFSVPGEDPQHSPQRYRAVLRAGKLEGALQQQGQADVPWTGVRAPTLLRKADPRWSASESLLHGADLTAWRFSSIQHGNWSVKDGLLASSGRGADILTNRSYQDLQLHVEWKCGTRANSGVYLRGRYEVQIETDSASEPPSHHTGGVYGFIAPRPEQPRAPDTWQTFDITLVGRQITVVQNGVVIVDRQEIPGITGGALDSEEAAPGPIILQGGEDGTVAFRNVEIRVPRSASGR